jgi:hypothetical protein
MEQAPKYSPEMKREAEVKRTSIIYYLNIRKGLDVLNVSKASYEICFKNNSHSSYDF